MNWRIKPLDDILANAERRSLKRSLGGFQLTMMGVGAIIGTGIFVLTAEAAQKAGPGMMVSFIIAGFVCAVAALCYAELASMVPVSGSAYTYSYAVMGEVVAWLVGWALVLEYAVAASAVLGRVGDKIVLASNNNNFTKAEPGQPLLISLDDAETLFHEFGHALHYLSSTVTYPALGNTPRDYVEYPSQVHEHWVLSRPILDGFMKHVETGKPMPQALVDKIEASQTFNQGYATVSYLSSALVDMDLHTRATPPTNIDAFERESLARLGMPKEIVMRHRLPQFNHLFTSDAYSAGYYSYLWSEVMDADTWAYFEESGDVFNPDIARRYKAIILAEGNTTDRAEAYRRFRGRDPDVTALLKVRGFPVS